MFPGFRIIVDKMMYLHIICADNVMLHKTTENVDL